MIVATGKSPAGQPVPVAWLGDALDQLARDGEIAEAAYALSTSS